MGQTNGKTTGEEHRPSQRGLDPDSLTASGRDLFVQEIGCGRSSVDSTRTLEDVESNYELDMDSMSEITLKECSTAEELEKKKLMDELIAIQKLPQNEQCADCNQPSSTWVSVTFGIFLCPACVGAHRSLGANVSFTRSITLDYSNIDQDDIEKLRSTGNKVSNEELEYCVDSDWSKPDNNCPGDLRKNYIKAKYQDKMFTKAANPGQPKTPPVFWTINHIDTEIPTLDRAHSQIAGKELYIGIIELRVISARNLIPVVGAISMSGQPAFYTNPYAVVQLGRSVVNTKTVHRTTNPVWNEGFPEKSEFSFPWDGTTCMRIAVWSNERMGKHKLMSSAVLDLGCLKKTKTVQSREVWVDLLERCSILAVQPDARESVETNGTNVSDDSSNDSLGMVEEEYVTTPTLREKLKDLFINSKSEYKRLSAIAKQRVDPNNALQVARLQRGYLPGGRLLVEISFRDLR